MGCSGTKADQTGENNGKFTYPKCSYTIQFDIELRSMLAVDNDKVLLGSREGIKILNINTKEITEYSNEHVGRINMLIKLKNGLVVSCGQDKTLKIWDLNKTKSIATMTGHTSMIWSISELSDGDLVTGSDDKTIRIWDMKEYKDKCILHESETECGAVIGLKNGRLLTSYENKVILYDVSSKSSLVEHEIFPGIWFFTELTNGHIACGSGNGDIHVIDVTDNSIKEVSRFIGGHKKSINNLIQVSNNYLLSSADEDTMIIWNLNNPDSKYNLTGHTEIITCTTMTENRKIISWAKDKLLKVWI